MRRFAIAVFLTMMTACAIEDTGSSDSGEPEVSAPVAEPETSSTSASLVNACANQCRNSSNQCFATCDRFPNPFCESRCEQRFANCMQACGCPFSAEFTRITIDHVVPRGIFLCVGPAAAPGFVHQVYDMFQRTERVRETLQCDGLTTEVVLSSTVSPAGTCNRRLFPDVPCASSTVPVANICVF
jgi:hypothetical protein